MVLLFFKNIFVTGECRFIVQLQDIYLVPKKVHNSDMKIKIKKAENVESRTKTEAVDFCAK